MAKAFENKNQSGITPAVISHDEEGIAFSSEYGDYYHSKKDAIAEAHYVFIEGNNLQHRWKRQKQYVIAETGFGTGLNVLTALEAWKNDDNRPDRLHIYSIEKHPLTLDQLIDIHNNYPYFQNSAQSLRDHYPPLLAGFHTFTLDTMEASNTACSYPQKVVLTLCFMDVAEALTQLPSTVDSWFLDGFSPSQNPEMWTQDNIAKMAECSRSGTSLATFTAASKVRRHLESAGFDVIKRKGFGKKREMLTATLLSSSTVNTLKHKPWLSYRGLSGQASSKKIITIIGAGIAGSQMAWHLAKRGYQVNVLERHSEAATEASGNPAGAVFPKLTATPNLGEKFYQACYLYTLEQLSHLQKNVPELEWHPCGVLQLTHNPRELKRWLHIKKRALPENFVQTVGAQHASELSGIELSQNALYFPQGGWINPRDFCQTLLNHQNITVHNTADVIQYQNHAKQWQCIYTRKTSSSEEKTTVSSDILIICSGRYTDWPAMHPLPSMPVKGQTSHLECNAYSSPLKTVLGHAGYMTPVLNNAEDAVGKHLIGATFERDIDNVLADERADQINQQQLLNYLEAMNGKEDAVSSAHAAVRLTTPDRFPYVGAVPDFQSFEKQYDDIHHGRMRKPYPFAEYQNGLFISTGYGSRGLTTAGLCSEFLACLINDEPLPIEQSLVNALHPARYLIKK